MVPVPVAVRFVTFPVFQEELVPEMVQVPLPNAIVRVLVLDELKPPIALDSVTL